jgi:predicted XRE-type DNA-binding protein/DNA-binding phage protein
MALTRDFKETVAARVQSDPAFAQALLDEAISLFVNGDPDSAKLILRDLVNATVGFEALAEEIRKPAKSLHQMLSRSGNPTMSNISAVFAAIKRAIDSIEIETSSGNVFADLGLTEADKLKIKSGLVIEITRAVRRLGLTQEEAGRRMGITQPKVSGMMRGDFTNLSERKLMECLNRLGYDIESATPSGTN